MAPNLVTMTAAACGIVAIILAQAGRWTAALVALFCSGVCDFCDGGVARLLNATSKLGAELDSLADFVNFGVAPALIMYYWIRPHIADFPPGSIQHDILTPYVLVAFAVFYAMSCSFRLARFNTLLAEPTTPRWSRYFMGVPAPGGAFLVLTPLLLWVGFGEQVDFLRSPVLGAILLLGIGILMVSRVPTFALKHFHASKRFVVATAAILLACFFILGFCETIGLLGVLYFATLPVFAIHGMRLPDQAPDESSDIAERPDDGA